MCNIITFRFTCQHMLHQRRSQCGGTKHKITATSIKAACIAQSFLEIYVRIECGTCQHKAWEDAWKTKLEKANLFLDKLRQRHLPGTAEIDTLVKGLEAEYIAASWDTRNMFAQAPKPTITRVKHTYYKRTASKLPQEVRAEDVIEKTVKEWTEMEDHDYDGNYIASTDPLHPVSTDYCHPLDDDDGAWILQHLSHDAVADTHPNTDLDFYSNNGWDWGENSSDSINNVASPKRETEDTGKDTIGKATISFGTALMAWGPEVNATPSKAKLQLSHPNTTQASHRTKVDQVIKAFWFLINNNDEQPSSPPANSDNNILTNVLHDLTIAESSIRTPKSPKLSTTPN